MIFDKNKRKVENFKLFHKNRNSQTANEKYSKNKNFYLTSTICCLLFYCAKQKSKYNYINIKTTRPISLTFVSNFLSFDSCVFIFIMFCISSNKLNSILCGIYLSFKSGHLELFCKIIIQLSFTGIYLGLWSKGSPCNFTEQLFFFHSCAWLLTII